jgi:hypothetical protein
MEELRITLSVEETNLILGSLSELPYKLSNGLITKITAQAEGQIKDSQTKAQTKIPTHAAAETSTDVSK